MPTLLEIRDDLLAFHALMEESADEDGVISQEAEQALEAWFAELSRSQTHKLNAYADLIDEWSLLAKARKELAARHAKAAQTYENNAKRLKDRLKMFLELQGLKKLETDQCKFSVCGNGGLQPMQMMTPVEELEKLDTSYIKKEANNEAIREALNNGVNIPGTVLLPRGTHLKIR